MKLLYMSSPKKNSACRLMVSLQSEQIVNKLTIFNSKTIYSPNTPRELTQQ